MMLDKMQCEIDMLVEGAHDTMEHGQITVLPSVVSYMVSVDTTDKDDMLHNFLCVSNCIDKALSRKLKHSKWQPMKSHFSVMPQPMLATFLTVFLIINNLIKLWLKMFWHSTLVSGFGWQLELISANQTMIKHGFTYADNFTSCACCFLLSQLV
jgi:hypothetical protein